MGWLAFVFGYGALNSGEEGAGQAWKLWTACALFSAAAAGDAVFWVLFACKRRLSRRTWHAGTGLILAGAALLFWISQFTTGVVYLLILAVWTQGHTRQFFDKA